MDTRLHEEEEVKITNAVLKHSDKFVDFHDLRSRKSGAKRHIDFHMTVCKYHTIELTHVLSDIIEDEIKLNHQEWDILIHQEPCRLDCNTCSLPAKNSSIENIL
jgi:divalent metal cation (Fe/Co/Zn/Cd) transporter